MKKVIFCLFIGFFMVSCGGPSVSPEAQEKINQTQAELEKAQADVAKAQAELDKSLANLGIETTTKNEETKTYTDEEKRKILDDMMKELEEDDKKEEEKKQAETPKTKWTYEKTKDKLRDTERYVASVNSDNSVHFDFPYSGGSKLQIMLRNWNNDNDVMLYITKGQFKSSYYGDEYISVKFDDGKLQKFYYVESDDGDSSYIFLNNEENFIRQIRKAKSLIIEAPFYSEGKRQFEFTNIDGVDF